MGKIVNLIKLDVMATTDIDDACEKALELACQEDALVIFTFNEITICIHPNDSPHRAPKEYHIRKGKG